MSIALVSKREGTGAERLTGKESPRGSNVARGGSKHPPRKNLGIEPAWLNGPLRKVGTGLGSPTVYVCGECMKPVQGVYYRERPRGAGIWVGGECR